MTNIKGKLFIGLSLTGVVILWIMSKDNFNQLAVQPLKTSSQAAALLGAVLVSIQYILTARLKLFENMFGGLDKAYRAHVIAGIVGFLLMLAHPLLLAFNALPGFTNAKIYLTYSSIISYNTGVTALYLFILLLIITLFVRISYQKWKTTHKLLILPLFALAAHINLISSDVSRSVVLKAYVLIFVFAGIIAYAYKQFFYPKYGPKFLYKIVQVNRLNSIVEIIAKPTGKQIEFLPGQFVFATFKSAELSPEEHPFTISSGPDEGLLRLSIKNLGDFTAELYKLKPDDGITIVGPYGRIWANSLNRNNDEVWIGGGIGITPMLSLAKYFASKPLSKMITIFYSIKNENEAVYLSELMETSRKNQNIKVIPFYSEKSGLINAGFIKEQAGNLSNKNFIVCGPLGLIYNITRQLRISGVKSSHITIEEFNFKP
jgi:predicted ferric reductase